MIFVAWVEILWNLVKISHFQVKTKIFFNIEEKKWALHYLLIFLQITKPIKGHLNSFNFIFLHNIQLPTSFFYFLQGFFGEPAREKRLKRVKIGLIMMISPVLISVLSMKIPLTVCVANIYRLCCVILRWFWFGIGKYGHF